MLIFSNKAPAGHPCKVSQQNMLLLLSQLLRQYKTVTITTVFCTLWYDKNDRLHKKEANVLHLV